MAGAMQRTAVPLGVSMNEATPRELLGPGELRLVQNGRVYKPGQLELRAGYRTRSQTVLDTGGTLTAGKRLLFRQFEQCLIDGHYLYSWISTAQKWKRSDRVPECIVEKRSVVTEVAKQDLANPSVAYANGYTCVVWADALTFDVWARVIHEASRTIIDETLLISADGHAPKVVACGNFLIAVYSMNSLGRIQARAFNTGAAVPAWGVATNLRTDFTAGSVLFDACGHDSDEFNLVYVRSTGELDVYRYDTSLAQTASSLDIRTTKTIASGPSIVSFGGILYIAYVQSTDNQLEAIGRNSGTLAGVFTTTLATAIATTPRLVVGERAAGTDCWVGWVTAQTATVMNNFLWRSVSSAGAAHATTHQTHLLTPLSDVFLYDGHSYCMCRVGSASEVTETIVLVDLGNDNVGDANYRARPVARLTEGDVHSVTQVQGSGIASGMGTGMFLVAFPVKDPTRPGFARGTGIELAEFWLDDAIAGMRSHRWTGKSEASRVTWVPGGLPHIYDGTLCYEAGFSFSPWIESIAALGAGTGSLAAGDYDYCVVYARQDAQGNWIRSRPSVVKTQTAAALDTVRLRIPHYTVTSMSDFDAGYRHPVVFEVYRRVSGVGSFVRLARLVATPALDPSDPLAATGPGNWFQFDDDGAARVQTNQPTLYTDGGTLENSPPPPCSFSCVWDGRLFCNDLHDPEQYQWTREIVDSEVPYFGDSWVARIPGIGRIVAFAVLDSSLIAFGQESIYFQQGTGPNDRDEGIAYSAWQRINTPVGCIDPRSVAMTPFGIVFRSLRGIELLDRSLSVAGFEWGHPIEDTVEVYETVQSVAFHRADGELRIALRDFEEGKGRFAVYQHASKAWAVDVLFGVNEYAAVDVAYHNGAFLWLHSAGTVSDETPGVYGDNVVGGTNHWITLMWETGDISMGAGGPISLTRWHRAILMGRRVGGHGLEIEFAFGRSDAYSTADQFTTAQVAAFLELPIEIAAICPSDCESHAFRVRVKTIQSTEAAPTAGPVWYALGLEHQTEPGSVPFPVPPDQRR